MDKILIVDDERDIVEMLCRYFGRQGYETFAACNGVSAIEQAGKKPDVILLDVNMPELDGFEVCARIREYVTCPIIFLTARIEDGDKVRGFAVGGDDYVVKPFSVEELGARVAAHLRRERRHGVVQEVRFDGDLAINYSERTVKFKGEPIAFAPKEFDIIEFLSQNCGQVFTRERIYEQVWSYEADGDSAVVAEHVRRIRVKFASCGAKPYIETIWGCGYKWAR